MLMLSLLQLLLLSLQLLLRWSVLILLQLLLISIRFLSVILCSTTGRGLTRVVVVVLLLLLLPLLVVIHEQSVFLTPVVFVSAVTAAAAAYNTALAHVHSLHQLVPRRWRRIMVVSSGVAMGLPRFSNDDDNSRRGPAWGIAPLG